MRGGRPRRISDKDGSLKGKDEVGLEALPGRMPDFEDDIVGLENFP